MHSSTATATADLVLIAPPRLRGLASYRSRSRRGKGVARAKKSRARRPDAGRACLAWRLPAGAGRAGAGPARRVGDVGLRNVRGVRIRIGGAAPRRSAARAGVRIRVRGDAVLLLRVLGGSLVGTLIGAAHR